MSRLSSVFKQTAFGLLIVAAIGACAPSPAALTPTVVPTNVSTSVPATSAVTIVPTAAPTGIAQAAALPDWASIPFTDARTNQTITLSQFAGKTIIVEGMAAWCTNCLHQQGQVLLAYPKFPANSIMISLDVDASENAAQLAKYAQDKRFPWTFGIAGKPLLDALIGQFGRTITNPPSTPIFMISPNGKVSELYTNGHDAPDLLNLIAQNSV